MEFLLVFFLVCYFGFIIFLIIGYRKLERLEDGKIKYTTASLIISFRNEEKNLPRLLGSIVKQSCSKQNFEVVFVNDNSTDKGVKVIDDYLTGSGISYKVIDLDNAEGKKEAIKKGVKSSQSDLILMTDADCELGVFWVEKMINAYEKNDAVLLSGPLMIKSSNEILSQVQSTEFSSLIASAAALVGLKAPIMVNAANLAFSKKVFLSIKPYASNKHVLSGDDIFLLHEIKKNPEYRKKIFFVNDLDAVVYIKENTSIRTFVNQRVRWASKSKYYDDGFTMLVGALVFIFNVSILIGFLLTLTGMLSLKLFFEVFVSKWLLDFMLLQQAPGWVEKNNLWIRTLLLSLLYPFYSISIALLSLLYRPKWKGRKI